MSKKITQEEFSKRFLNINDKRDFTIIQYTAISKPCIIKCNKCGKEIHYSSGNNALSATFCCEQIDRLESIKSRLTDEYQFVKQVDKDNIIIKHLICGNEQKRAIQSAFKEPCSCNLCNGSKFRTMISLKEYQERLDEQFGFIKILEYNGQLKKNKYKCLKCGLIFERDAISQKSSRGCPKCDKNTSNGERKMCALLDEYGINYKQQYSVQELPLQKFDFAIFKDDKLMYFIEVNGEQHYEQREVFDPLEKTIERDNKKRNYCKENNIPLYEIKWFKGEFKNLEILPFLSSTTITDE